MAKRYPGPAAHARATMRARPNGTDEAMNAWSIFLSAAAAAAAGAAAWAAVYPTSEIFGPAVHHTRDSSTIALTFDDGPNPACTPQLLALLERHGAPATFFLVGRFARACPELVREIAVRGHTIGNHTETHPNLAWMPAWRIAEELRACQDSVFRALRSGPDAAPCCMRPPFGYRGPQLWTAVRSVGLSSVAMWSLGSYDWRHHSAPRLIERLGAVSKRSGASSARGIESRVSGANAGSNEPRERRGGQIVLLHDGDFRQQGNRREHVLAALEHWLPRWRGAGFEFVTMSQLTEPRASASS
jgi:peptidoglycan/xylan/chitin deacetylase (PgdA/CDA1 family)